MCICLFASAWLALAGLTADTLDRPICFLCVDLGPLQSSEIPLTAAFDH